MPYNYTHYEYRFGPLSANWAMRYEARHCYFKKLSSNIGNFINLPWTLAKRHQLMQCYHHSSSKESIVFDEPDIGPGIHMVIMETAKKHHVTVCGSVR